MDPHLDPKVLLAVIGALFAGLTAVTKILLVTLERRINEKFTAQESHNALQDNRLNKIEDELQEYKAHVAVGVKEAQTMRDSIRSIADSVADHIKREEGITWTKIDSIADGITKIQLDNEKAHSGIIERIAAVEAKFNSINGYKATRRR